MSKFTHETVSVSPNRALINIFFMFVILCFSV